MVVVVGVLIGVVVGVVLTGSVVVRVMRTRMVVAHRSRKDFEGTVEAIGRVVGEDASWSFPIEPLDMAAKLAAKGHMPEGIERIKVFFVCNPAVAEKVLGVRPEMSGIMPCTWAVYELADGSVWLAKMNIGMMAKMFGGVVGRAMGEVEAADRAFLSEVL